MFLDMTKIKDNTNKCKQRNADKTICWFFSLYTYIYIYKSQVDILVKISGTKPRGILSSTLYNYCRKKLKVAAFKYTQNYLTGGKVRRTVLVTMLSMLHLPAHRSK